MSRARLGAGPQRSNPRREINLTLLVELVLQCSKARLKRYLKVLAKELFLIGDEAISEPKESPPVVLTSWSAAQSSALVLPKCSHTMSRSGLEISERGAQVFAPLD